MMWDTGRLQVKIVDLVCEMRCGFADGRAHHLGTGVCSRVLDSATFERRCHDLVVDRLSSVGRLVWPRKYHTWFSDVAGDSFVVLLGVTIG